ncbi:hypothetical protein PC129_g18478 [Phytophthora cactorum]|uniref:Uncharacterized protein n=1 Tax=Phytophthora cactorum TaxID=29920 RepID=A0A8T1AVK1_9STRA|nr:hypothetical protein PC113_g15064 [Phytophthora cactorum]KAG2881296.1 hypothetical protein PC114_g21632 [Phytophthora cactorum]KAG2891183.1 hypothetical protein PC115_g19288 [Phytophthora cactorum]KAG2902861.1 hypothetical protein PC117_g21386 [Phytophthora cactorum]KAG2980564.1 hypothetical protein PC119_g21236 [Phytophthora cactorum]
MTATEFRRQAGDTSAAVRRHALPRKSKASENGIVPFTQFTTALAAGTDAPVMPALVLIAVSSSRRALLRSLVAEDRELEHQHE